MVEKEKISLEVDSNVFDEYMSAVMEWQQDKTEKKRNKVARIWKKMLNDEGLEVNFFEEYSKNETQMCSLCGRSFIPKTKKQEYCRRKSFEANNTRCSQIAIRLKLCYGDKGIERYKAYFKKVEPLNILKEKGKITDKVYQQKKSFYNSLYRKANQGKITDEEYYDAINNSNGMK